MRIKFKFGGWTYHGMIGHLDFTWSIQRAWKGDSSDYPTWRHITIGLRSPLLRQPGALYKDGKPRYVWYRPRFGFGCGNLYLGVVYILTSFGRQHPPLKYSNYGPIELARQPSMGEHLGRARP